MGRDLVYSRALHALERGRFLVSLLLIPPVQYMQLAALVVGHFRTRLSKSLVLTLRYGTALLLPNMLLHVKCVLTPDCSS